VLAMAFGASGTVSPLMESLGGSMFHRQNYLERLFEQAFTLHLRTDNSSSEGTPLKP
jgi:hypothetical protein